MLGALWAALGVTLGAFGAHLLREGLTARNHVDTWETAVFYHLVHALALIAYGLYIDRARGRDLPALLFFLGSALFSGSLYVLSFDVVKGVMGPITPLGGALSIAGWVLFALEARRR